MTVTISLLDTNKIDFRNKSTSVKREYYVHNLYTIVQSSISNNQKLETKYPTISEQTLVHLHCGILFNNKKE